MKRPRRKARSWLSKLNLLSKVPRVIRNDPIQLSSQVEDIFFSPLKYKNRVKSVRTVEAEIGRETPAPTDDSLAKTDESSCVGVLRNINLVSKKLPAAVYGGCIRNCQFPGYDKPIVSNTLHMDYFIRNGKKERVVPSFCKFEVHNNGINLIAKTGPMKRSDYYKNLRFFGVQYEPFRQLVYKATVAGCNHHILRSIVRLGHLLRGGDRSALAGSRRLNRFYHTRGRADLL